MFEFDFSPPEELTISLWRSLLLNVLDRLSPERLPPLQLTSKPVDVGILVGDLVDLPWYRTVFTNLGDVISPETLPPLELESRPVDVGELLGDDLSRGWWDTLMASLRDRLAPEKLPPLDLTSQPVAVFGAESSLQILDWSTLISTPKVFLKDAPPQEPREEVPISSIEEAEQPAVQAGRQGSRALGGSNATGSRPGSHPLSAKNLDWTGRCRSCFPDRGDVQVCVAEKSGVPERPAGRFFILDVPIAISPFRRIHLQCRMVAIPT